MHLLIVCSLKFFPDDLRKQPLVRTLQACFVEPNIPLLQFLYRLIRDRILDDEYFSAFKYTDDATVVLREFETQFFREFNFNAAEWNLATDFNHNLEWLGIVPILRDVEHRYPSLERPWPFY